MKKKILKNNKDNKDGNNLNNISMNKYQLDIKFLMHY